MYMYLLKNIKVHEKLINVHVSPKKHQSAGKTHKCYQIIFILFSEKQQYQ